MKKLIIVILCLVFIAVLFSTAIIGYRNMEERSIKVMSFNIRCLAIEENIINSWGNRQDDVINVIKKYQPDIIGFQEIKFFQIDFMIEELEDKYNHYEVFRSDNILSAECTAIFYRKDRFEVLEEDTFWLSQTPDVMSVGWDASMERICSRLTLKDKHTNKIFNHFNTHFDHQGALAQQQSVFLLLEKIEESGFPAIVTGDFNVKEESNTYNSLIANKLKDAKYLAKAENRDEGATYNGFGRYIEGKPIDFIFTTKEDFLVNTYTIIRDTDDEGNYPSDHFPIMSIIKQSRTR